MLRLGPWRYYAVQPTESTPQVGKRGIDVLQGIVHGRGGPRGLGDLLPYIRREHLQRLINLGKKTVVAGGAIIICNLDTPKGRAGPPLSHEVFLNTFCLREAPPPLRPPPP